MSPQADRELDPTLLAPHPLAEQLFPADDKRNQIIREAESFREQPKVTNDSHFSEADWTIISGHRRVDTAVASREDTIEVAVVGPFASAQEERKAVLEANGYRNTTPAEEILYAEAWEEVYVAQETVQNPARFAVRHVDCTIDTYRQGTYVKDVASEAIDDPVDDDIVSLARALWEELTYDEQDIETAYLAIKRAEERTGEVHAEEWPSVPAETVSNWDADASRLGTIYTSETALRVILRRVTFDETLDPTDDDQFVHLSLGEDVLELETRNNRGDIQEQVTIDEGYVEDLTLLQDRPVGLSVNLRELRLLVDLLEGPATIAWWGSPGSQFAHLLTLTDGTHQFRLKPPDPHEESTPQWLPEVGGKWLPE